MTIYTADEGKLYQHKTNFITAKTLLIGKYDSIDNYNLIDEPEPIPEPEPEPTSLEERVQKLEEDKEPLEAQVTFTAVMTDTLLDEEEEEEE